MDLALCSLASGSSGNCYLVKSNTTAILVDVGISAKQICERLWACGLEVDDIDGILLTHEHTDHTKGLKVLLKSNDVKLYVNRKTYEGTDCELPEEKISFIQTGDKFEIGDILVTSFHNSHDANDPTGFSLESKGRVVTIVTDTGFVTDEAYSCMQRSDILVLESNHDVNVLKMGRYPWFLKKRILGDKGHLSNDAAAEILLKLFREGFWCAAKGTSGDFKCRQVLLAHLSAENNFPEMALATATNILEAEGINVGKDLKISTLSRTDQSPMYSV